MSKELAAGGEFVYVSSSIAPAGKAKSAPPMRKKPRTHRGQNSKSHEGDRAPNPNKINTNVTPGDYLQTIQCSTLKDEEKLPHYVVSDWKRSNGRETFTRRINQGTAEHETNPTLQRMQAH